MHGHLRFSPEEVDAVRVVSAVQTERALNEGTGSAGLFAIPFTLDPSIVISNTARSIRTARSAGSKPLPRRNGGASRPMV